ncbi:MAG: Crp/Fnr family transcriptional regulator [Pseudomonadota bacterium]
MSATPIILPAPTDTEASSATAEPQTASYEAIENSDDSEIPSILSQIAPFKGLSDAVLDAIAETAEYRRYDDGQTVLSLGQYDGGEFFVVTSGAMRASIMQPESGSIVVEDIEPIAVFGLDLTYAGEDNPVFQNLAVTAEGDLALIAIDAEKLRAVAAQRPSLMRNLAQYFAEELSARRFHTVAAEAAPEQRVYAELLSFVERDGVQGVWRIARMPKHREIADRAGVEEAVAAGAVASLIQEGVAQRDYPGLIINDMSRLNKLAS